MLSSAAKPAGHTVWYIPDGYLAASSKGDLVSHEAVCVLNTSAETAQIRLDFYFEDRPPLKDVAVAVGPESTQHVRLDKLRLADGSELPREVPYAIRVRSSVPVIVQHSRLDVTQPELALFTTMGWPEH